MKRPLREEQGPGSRPPEHPRGWGILVGQNGGPELAIDTRTNDVVTW